MRPSTGSDALVVICLAAGALPACSSRGAGTGNAACHQGPIWDATSLSFSLSRTPSFFTNDVRTYDFSLPGRTLIRQGCRSTLHVDRSLSLSNDNLALVLAAVGALQSSCEERCGTDAPQLTLTIHAANGDHTYHADLTCLGPLYITVEALQAFENSLDDVLDGANTAMDGGADAAAHCPVGSAGD